MEQDIHEHNDENGEEIRHENNELQKIARKWRLTVIIGNTRRNEGSIWLRTKDAGEPDIGLKGTD